MGLAIRLPRRRFFQRPCHWHPAAPSYPRNQPAKSSAPGRPTCRNEQTGLAPYLPSLFRHPPPAKRLRYPNCAGIARPQGCQNHHDLYPRPPARCKSRQKPARSIIFNLQSSILNPESPCSARVSYQLPQTHTPDHLPLAIIAHLCYNTHRHGIAVRFVLMLHDLPANFYRKRAMMVLPLGLPPHIARTPLVSPKPGIFKHKRAGQPDRDSACLHGVFSSRHLRLSKHPIFVPPLFL